MAKYSIGAYQQVLRIGVFLLLASKIAIIGYFSFAILHQNELQTFNRVYDSSTDRISHGVALNLQAKLSATSSAANMYTFASQKGLIGIAPNLTLPGFEEIMQPMTKLAGVRSIGFMPVLSSTTRKGWEAYARSHLNELGNLSSINKLNIPAEIFMKDLTGRLVYDPGNFSDSKYPDLVTPVWQVAPLVSYGKAIMYNVHSEKIRVTAIDKLMSTNSPVFTDVLRLVVDAVYRPASFIFYPVKSFQNDKVIGIIFATLTWDDMLQNALPSYLSGIHIVLSTSTQKTTFVIQDGNVELLGDGDLHDPRFDHYRRDISSSLDAISSLLASDYTLELYPTEDIVGDFITQTPGILSGLSIAIIVFTSVVLLFYDYLTRSERKRLLEELVLSDLKSKLSDLALRELQMKTSFIRYVSHEVRNPLNIVALGLDQLRQHVQEENTEFFDTINDLEGATRHAVDIMDNLLTFEKLTSNVLEINQAEVSVFEYLQSAIRPSLIQAKEKGVEVCMDVDERITKNNPKITLDNLKIHRVIQNLLCNSINFAPSGTRVEITASIILKKKYMGSSPYFLIFQVVDHGCGISQKNQDRLFKEVAEFTPGDFHDGKGSGLSLWISHEIVALHGGKLSVFSEGLGCGAAFTMELPLQGNSDVGVLKKKINGRNRNREFIARELEVTVQRDESPSYHGVSYYRTPMKNPLNNLGNKLGGYIRHNPEKTCQEQHDGVVAQNSIESTQHHRFSAFGPSRSRFEARGVVPSPHGLPQHQKQPQDDTEAHQEAPLRGNCGRFVDSVGASEWRVLIVDDVPMNRKMHQRLIERRCKHISMAEDGKVAVEIVSLAITRGEGYDIILMDFEMPNMNGPDAAAAMRDIGYTGLIIGVTGNGLPVDIDHFLQKGADKVLIKPISLTMLDNCLTTIQ